MGAGDRLSCCDFRAFLHDRRLADMGASRLEEVFLGDASGALEDVSGCAA